MTSPPFDLSQHVDKMTKPTAGIRRSPLDFLLTGSQQVAAIIGMCLYFQYFVYRTERLMDSYLNQHTFLQQLRESVAPSLEAGPRYLVFKQLEQGQGIGNVMNGLLAAHMLGMEFNRTVCVAEDWDEFHQAFHAVKHVEECAAIDPNGKLQSTIKLLNFQPPPNECRLQTRLASDTPVLYMIGNTYPRWSKTPPELWDEHYEPTERLINTLPYNKRPSTVVHLRQPDDEEDHRSGLDNATLHALAKKLPNNTFLVTNNVEWYTFFEAHGWKNPSWHKVRHSALPDVEWASGDSATDGLAITNQTESRQDDGTMQLWSDWYTILRADHVYHTHSDFSLSAIHWNEIDSKTILGSNAESGELVLSEESWRIDEPMPRVVDRTGDELKICDQDTDDMGGYLTFDDAEGPIDDVDDAHVFGEDKQDGEAMEDKLERDLQKGKPRDWIDDVLADATNPEGLTEEDND